VQRALLARDAKAGSGAAPRSSACVDFFWFDDHHEDMAAMMVMKNTWISAPRQKTPGEAKPLRE
jgi:hypothetical protein